MFHIRNRYYPPWLPHRSRTRWCYYYPHDLFEFGWYFIDHDVPNYLKTYKCVYRRFYEENCNIFKHLGWHKNISLNSHRNKGHFYIGFKLKLFETFSRMSMAHLCSVLLMTTILTFKRRVCRNVYCSWAHCYVLIYFVCISHSFNASPENHQFFNWNLYP